MSPPVNTFGYVAFDTETHLTRPGCQAPPMVCISISDDVDEAVVIHRRDPRCEQYVRYLIDAALGGECYLVGQNIAYDLAVIMNEWPDLTYKIFALYDNDRVLDTMIRQKLLDIADGCYRGEYVADGTEDENGEANQEWLKNEYNLQKLAKRHDYPLDLDKDTWRLRYRELDYTPVIDWPQDAVDYSAHDSKSTLWVAIEQMKHSKSEGRLLDQYRQNRAAFALHLVSAWGLRTDPVMVALYRKTTQARLDSHRANLLARGFLKQIVKGKDQGKFKKETKKMQEYVAQAWILKGQEELMPLTKGGKTGIRKPALDEEAVGLLGDPIATAYQEWGSSITALGHVAEWERGIEYPIHTYFDELLVTGRSSSSGPNIQNRSTKPGDRECVVPRKGYVFCDVDYSGLELCTVSQVCMDTFGRSALGNALNTGIDPHCVIASQLLDISYEEAVRRKKLGKEADLEFYWSRQTGKVANFGLAGGLGWKRLIKQAKAEYDVVLTEASAKKLIEIWKETWPEFANDYFPWIKAQCGEGGYAREIHHVFSERVRGNARYTEACNTYFQGLGADVAKLGLWALVKATFIGDSILRHCRVVNFVHDEFITEVPEEIAHDCAVIKSALVTEAANKFLPAVPSKVECELSRRWSKSAKPLYDENKRLIPWEWDVAKAAGSRGYAE